MLTHSAKIVQTSEIDEVCFNDYYTKKEMRSNGIYRNKKRTP